VLWMRLVFLRPSLLRCTGVGVGGIFVTKNY
jgi:hypothetical protein